MSISIEWNDGAPEKLEAGMALLYPSGSILIVGILKPHEVAWLESQARAHGVGR